MRSLLEVVRSAFAELRRFLRDPMEYFRELRVRRRRHKLVMVYAKEARVRHGLGPGLSPLLYAYDRRVDDGTLRFRETTADGVLRAGGSRWRVATGRALDGPYEGSRLESAASGSQLYWAAWLQFHPETTVYGID